MTGNTPRLVVAGLSGDSGKTTVSLSLLSAWRDRGLSPVAFKKGPDFIDAAWLGWAAGNPGRNLDTFLMSARVVRRLFARHAPVDRISVVEGNRGLCDGMDVDGTHSTAALARLIEAPIVLVVPVTKVTRTAAASVIGLRVMEPDLNIAGVILNRVRGPRHEAICRGAIERHAGVPVLGVLPRLADPVIRDRHLGLVTPAESGDLDALRAQLVRLAEESMDLDRIERLARSVSPTTFAFELERDVVQRASVRIGVMQDTAFTFYYPENLEALRDRGAELVFLSALEDRELPELDALYIGGGFPETHAERIAGNRRFLDSLRAGAGSGLPIYAECGGLMLLADSIRWGDTVFSMAGVFPFCARVGDKPARSHGYMAVKVDRANPFYPVGSELVGHEFHYSRVADRTSPIDTAFSVVRGGGCFDGRDGLLAGNVLACYLHVHAAGVPSWADGLVRAAAAYRERRRLRPDTDGFLPAREAKRFAVC